MNGNRRVVMKRFLFLLSCLVAGLVSVTCLAAEPNVKEQVGTLVQLFRSHEWRPAIALLLTILIYFWRRFDKIIIAKIESKYIPWITALMGFLATLPSHLSVTPFVWANFILDGFVTGAESALLWSLVGKAVLPKVFGEVGTEEEKTAANDLRAEKDEKNQEKEEGKKQ
jgi:hypothetical protein